jgi:DNA-binding HxlR family transcriptional regulator
MDLLDPGAVTRLARMKGYGQFCPVAVASEVFAQRWTPLIIRELCSGRTHFNDIHRGIPLISRSLLADRLRWLQRAGVVSSAAVTPGRVREYRLTEAGSEFRAAIDALGAWGQRWSVRVDPQNLDADFLMWQLHHRLARDLLPVERVVVNFSFRGRPRRRSGSHLFWLVLERPQVELCLSDPGHEVDLYVDADLRAFAQVWLGDAQLADAVRDGGVKLVGARKLVKAFPTWLLLSRFADVPRPAQ